MGDARCHIVLVGLMGSGKTTVGKKVARLVGRHFIDADVELEARTGRSVAEWFAESEEAFRDAESELLTTLLASAEPFVIGAGGGVVLRPENRAALAGSGVTTVYLHGEPAFLASRAQAKPHRPLLVDADPVELFTRMHAERDRWYREVAAAVVEIRPAYEAGEQPKWRLAEDVVEALLRLGAIQPREVAGFGSVSEPGAPDQQPAGEST